ncbi:MAG TPA: ABC transporter permease [Candidatus Sulfotelmatobacter sp.]|nr:ABC transporter permease [Candidatus Sulfotelmatobacter sp.]
MAPPAMSRWWLLAPVLLLYGALALLPVAVIVHFSLAGGGNYRAVLGSPLLARAITNTLVISLYATVITLALGFLLAATLWRSGPGMRRVLLAFILLPFWTAVLIKNFAWAALLQDNGAINAMLQGLGLTGGPVTLLHNRLAVVIGMVHYTLPYAVFPIYTALQAIDPRLEQAARSLGAGALPVLRHVVLPLSLPGVYSAALLVFIVAAGFFITPIILGGPSDMMIANLVDYYLHEMADFGRASALAVLILAVTAVLVTVQQALPREGQHGVA